MKPTIAGDSAGLELRWQRAQRCPQQCTLQLRRRIWSLTVGFTSVAIRAGDVIVATAVLLALCWYWLPRLIVSGPAKLQRIPKVGRKGEIFQEFSWCSGAEGSTRRLDRLPVWFNVLRGHLSLVGPRASSPEEWNAREGSTWIRQSVRPGLISLWHVRQGANIAYEDERSVDAEFVAKLSVSGILGIAVRALLVKLYGAPAGPLAAKIRISGIPLDNMSLDDALRQILAWADATNSNAPRQVCFVNADCVNIAHRDPKYMKALQAADLSLGDGIGIKLAAQLLGTGLRQNVNGTDLFPRLCGALTERQESLFLLGARPGVADGVSNWIQRNYPGVQIAGVENGYFTDAEQTGVLQRIRTSGAHILLVAFGAPRQDLWIREHLQNTGVRVAIGVGGLFDFYSGRIPRAPQWLRELGLEWTYRLYQEPGRMWKRYLWGNLIFLLRAIWQRFGTSSEGNSQ